MNVIRSRLNCHPTIVENIFQVTRGYAVQKNVPINWVMPVKHSCISKEISGDGGIDFGITSNDYIKDFEKSDELKDADEIVKRMFTIGFQPRKLRIELQKEKAKELVQRHSHDTISMECRFAHITAEILQLQEHQEENRRNSKSKVLLKELIERRKKWLRKLRIQDYARFEFLLERLNLVYHPFPEDNPRIKRKASTKQLLKKYCKELKESKLLTYKQELEAQQKDFFKEKADKLEFIRNEEIACGVSPTVTEEEIAAAKQKAASFVQ